MKTTTEKRIDMNKFKEWVKGLTLFAIEDYLHPMKQREPNGSWRWTGDQYKILSDERNSRSFDAALGQGRN